MMDALSKTAEPVDWDSLIDKTIEQSRKIQRVENSSGHSRV